MQWKLTNAMSSNWKVNSNIYFMSLLCESECAVSVRSSKSGYCKSIDDWQLPRIFFLQISNFIFRFTPARHLHANAIRWIPDINLMVLIGLALRDWNFVCALLNSDTHYICRLDETTTTLWHSDLHSHKHTQHSIRKTAFKTIQVKVTHFEFNWLL